MADSRTWAFILLAAAGCEWKVTSRVLLQVTAPLARARDDGTRETPLGGAFASIRCPDGAVEKLGSTDSSGSVLVTTRAPVRLDCDLAVDYRGRPFALVAVGEACSRQEAGECRVLEARLTLDPKAEPLMLTDR